MEVPNSGSFARDHMANERTLLAWIRTGIALIAIGLAFSKFVDITYGIVFVSLGIIFFIYSAIRYLQIKHSLERGYFIINKSAIYILVTIIIMLSIGALIIMLYR